MWAMTKQLDAWSPIDGAASREDGAAGGNRAARHIYLETIGLTKSDPFVAPVSEQEVDLSQYLSPPQIPLAATTRDVRQPAFFDFVSPPPLSDWPPDLSVDESLALLQEPRAHFIYGLPGSGKTTLRLALDAHLRQKPKHTLSVTYCRFPTNPDSTNHWTALAAELAIDLFIQIVEQIESFGEPSPAQLDALRAQVLVGGLSRLVERILDDPEPPSFWGLGTLWPSVSRSTVRRVVSSPALIKVLAQSRLPQHHASSPQTGYAALLDGLQAAQRWGFKQTIVMIDGVDTPKRDIQFMLNLIQPVISALPDFEAHHVTFRFFLPLELRAPVSALLQSIAPNLTSAPLDSIMGPWNDASLRRLLAQRFRAAGSRRVGFDNLAGPGLENRLDELLIRSANGSPRRLLQLISSLIDHHAARDPHDRLITLDDWQSMRAQWRDNPPALLPSEI
jgi:hypothetical protein